MYIVGLFFLLLVLFLLLGVSASITLNNVRILGRRLRISSFVLGLILGVLTTLPETFIGINASLQGVGQISFGNLMGGSIVLLGFIAGISIIANRVISTRESFAPQWLVGIGLFILLPIFLGLDGLISVTDGLILVTAYFLIINGLINSHKKNAQVSPPHPPHKSLPTTRAILFSLVGIAGILVTSRFIVDTATSLSDILSLPLFVSGLLIFSLGTNLPELSVVFTAWRRHVKQLGLGNIIGSAFTNSMVVGALSFLRPISVPIHLAFWIFFLIFVLVVIIYVYFAITGREFTRTEGVILLSMYIVFLVSQFSCVLFPHLSLCSL